MRSPWPLSKPGLYAILMIAAAITSLLPARWTSCVDSLTQPISPITWAVSSSVHALRNTADDLTTPAPSASQAQELLEQNERYLLQLRQQGILIDELEQIIRDLSGLREQMSDERARIVFASVIGGETSPLRETLRISRGTRHGIRVGDWVAAGLPKQERHTEGGGRDLLMQQWLIGVVSEAFPYVSDVRLTTDPGFRPNTVFWVARVVTETGTQLEIAPRECSLEGIGHQKMLIDRAAEDYESEGYNIVLAPLAYPQPLALVLGQIEQSRALETGLHYQFVVKPWSDARTLTHVYVISLVEP